MEHFLLFSLLLALCLSFAAGVAAALVWRKGTDGSAFYLTLLFFRVELDLGFRVLIIYAGLTFPAEKTRPLIFFSPVFLVSYGALVPWLCSKIAFARVHGLVTLAVFPPIVLNLVLFLSGVSAANQPVFRHILVVYHTGFMIASAVLLLFLRGNPYSPPIRFEPSSTLAAFFLIYGAGNLALLFLSPDKRTGFFLPLFWVCASGAFLVRALSGKAPMWLSGVQRPGRIEEGDPRFERFGFTFREGQIAVMILNSQTNKEIGATLCIAHGTVKNHVSNLFNKAKVGNRRDFCRLFSIP